MKQDTWIDHFSKLTANKPAIIFGGREQSYAQLADGIARLAMVLKQQFGIKKGDRIAWLGNNSPKIIEALFACAKTGAILVPLNWRLAVPELVQILADAEVSLLIVGDDQVETAVAIATQLKNCPLVHAYGLPQADTQSGSWPVLQTLQDQLKDMLPIHTDRPENPVLILYTSGTSGKPKGVVLTQDALMWSARNSVLMHGMTASDHILMVLPMFHAGGINIQTLPALSVGATISLHEVFEPGRVLAQITSGRPTLTALVPTQISALTTHPDWNKTDVNQLRSVTTGSTLVPDFCVEAWAQRGVTALQVYGTTETCAVAIHQTCENVESTSGSMGRPAAHCKIRVVDDDGVEIPVGEHGEILIKGPGVFKEYWRDPAATEQALTDGWFHSSDIGFQRADGTYVISDRKADLIISGGENIYPAELEAILNGHPEIIEAAVIAQADERWGEVPVALVVTTADSGLDKEGVKALFNDRLARFKHPRQVQLVAQLPRNAMGKIEKFKLRRWFVTEQEF